MPELNLHIHGVNVGVQADHARFTDDLARRLAFFLQRAPTAGPDIECTFSLVSSASRLAKPRGGSRLLCDPVLGEMLYFPARDDLYLALPGLRMRTRPGEGTARIVVEDDPRALWLATRSVFGFVLTESLKRRGLFSLHAASVELNGRALLLAGVNGAGKSTLTVALLQAGATGFQGDDLVFLQTATGAVDVLPFPDSIAATEETTARLPMLDVGPLPAGARKHEIDPAAIASVPVPDRLPAAALVLLEPREGGYRLEPVSALAALVQLAPNVLATETTASQRHLDALGALVRSVPCYRLEGRAEPGVAVEVLRALA